MKQITEIDKLQTNIKNTENKSLKTPISQPSKGTSEKKSTNPLNDSEIALLLKGAKNKDKIGASDQNESDREMTRNITRKERELKELNDI